LWASMWPLPPPLKNSTTSGSSRRWTEYLIGRVGPDIFAFRIAALALEMMRHPRLAWAGRAAAIRDAGACDRASGRVGRRGRRAAQGGRAEPVKPLPGRQFCRLLERNGWSLLRIHSSHHVDGKPGIGSGSRSPCMAPR
jgi:hypothetical protein